METVFITSFYDPTGDYQKSIHLNCNFDGCFLIPRDKAKDKNVYSIQVAPDGRGYIINVRRPTNALP
jgi:hypothetical protein